MSTKLIFLDIDGVLYPCSRRRFILRNTVDLRSQLKKKGYSSAGISDHDLCMVAYGFDHLAVEFLRNLLQETQAVLVISSSWKFSHTLEALKALFSLHDLDSYMIDITPNSAGFMKETGIIEYLETYSDTQSYLVLDDIDMRDTFHERAIVCPDVFDEACYEEALMILKNR